MNLGRRSFDDVVEGRRPVSGALEHFAVGSTQDRPSASRSLMLDRWTSTKTAGTSNPHRVRGAGRDVEDIGQLLGGWYEPTADVRLL